MTFIRLSHCKCKSLMKRSPRLLSVCRLFVYSDQISKTKRDMRKILSPLWEVGSPSKNMTSDFALEVAK